MALADMAIAALALQYFGKGDAVTATALVWPESGGNPDAVGPTDSSGDHPIGLWQVKAKLHGYTEAQLKDPQTNAKAAADVKHSEGWSAWAVYNNGAFRLYLARAQAAVSANLKGNPDGPWVADITKQKPQAVPDWFGPLTEPLQAIANAFQFATDPANWLRLATFVAGGFVVLLGVLFLIGSSKPVQKAVSIAPQTRGIAAAARKVAA